MKNTRMNKGVQLSAIRISALACLVLEMVARLVFCRSFDVGNILLDMIPVCIVLLFATYGQYTLRLRLAMSIMVSFGGVALAMNLTPFLPEMGWVLEVLPYVLMIEFAFFCVMMVWAWRMRSDLHFKSLYFSGEEISFSAMGQVFNMCSLLLMSLALFVSGMDADWLGYIMLVLETSCAVILAFRSYLSSPVLCGGHRITDDYNIEDDLENANRNDIYSKLCLYMKEERPFLDPSFDLDDLALHFYTNRGYLSRLINTHAKMNFSQFVNKYRLEYAMTLYMKDPSLKIGELASLSGYANRVTFHTAFKVFYSITPSQWCVKYRESVGLNPPSLSTNEDTEQ